MRAFWDVLAFEVRVQGRTPLFLGVVLFSFLSHLLTMAEIGIHISDNPLILINSPFKVFQTELVLGLFGMLPAVIFIIRAIVRDDERQMLELFYTTPVGRTPWLLGRFAGGTVCALVAGLAGLIGTIVGGAVPGLDADRVAPFTILPYAAVFVLFDVPNLVVFCAICFALAAISRSQAWAFAAALALLVVELVLYNAATPDAPAWLALLDPLGAVPIRTASQYWTVAELNTRVPVTGWLLANRVVWMCVGAGSLGVAVAGVRLVLPLRQQATRRRWWELFSRRRSPEARVAVQSSVGAPSRASTPAVLAPFLSQVRIDLRAVVASPIFAIVVVLAMIATVSEFGANTDGLLGLPLHPTTGSLLGIFRYGLFQFVLAIVIYYSAVLVFRERDLGLAEIVGATPHPDWIMPLSKVVTLATAVVLVQVASIATCIALQLQAGHTRLDLGVYLQSLFVYNGFYFMMLVVLAIAVQTISPGKWSGMLLLAAWLAGLLSLEPLGFEHVLYGFRIPFVVYSDMNGFGHYRLPTLSLIVYWGLFCVLLLVVSHVCWWRGTAVGARERVREARLRMTPGLMRAAMIVALLFVSSGGWIYWNTNILNVYETQDTRLRARAAYERAFGAWKNRPTPTFSDLTLEVNLYPAERRLESRGRATLTNLKDEPIATFAVSTDPRLRLDTLAIDGATISREDTTLGVRLVTLDPPLPPGATVSMTWTARRTNRGFVNAGADDEIVDNGTFVDLLSIVPIPAYDETRELTDPVERRRAGLPPAARLPSLGDPAWLNTLGVGVDARTTFRIVLGTSADQTAVAPGVLRREWTTGDRRYFEYDMEQPVWPRVSLHSARYAVERDHWQDVALEVYHDAAHAWNVSTMLETAKQALSYFSREFVEYPFRSFRIREYPRYRGAARAYPGAVAYSESAGFLTDLRAWAPIDYATVHELAHQWWGGMVYGARMQGRQMLNETMAQYSTLMVLKQQPDPQWLRRVLASTHRNHLSLRRQEGVAEQPLMYTEDQGNISYNKGALVMFALQERIGSERLHRGLRAFLEKFAMQPPPFPTSRDLISELRAVAGPDDQAFITDLFERIVLYDVAVTAVGIRPVDGEYEVTVDVTARQFEADGRGAEHEVPLDAWFDLVLFPDPVADLAAQTPISQTAQRLRTGVQRRVLRVPVRPAAVGIDPFHVMIDHAPDNNVYRVPPS